MGCSASKLGDEEAVQLCRDRRNFIKQAVEQRARFAFAHDAYIRSLSRVSHALSIFVNREELHNLLNSYMTPPFTPVKRLSPEIIDVQFKSFAPTNRKPGKTTARVVNYLRSGGEPTVTIEESPGSPETVRIESHYPMDNYGFDRFFSMDSPFVSSPNHRPGYPPPSPQTSHWDFFWNPFSSLDVFGYPSRNSFDRTTSDDEMARLRRVREEEGIPELEEEGEEEGEEEEEREDDVKTWTAEIKDESKPTSMAVASEAPSEVNIETETVNREKEAQIQGAERIKVSAARKAVELEVTNEQEVVGSRQETEETLGFTVYLNRRPASIGEVIKDLNYQFMRICDTAREVSVMLEVSRAQHPSSSNILAGAAISNLNPIALFRSASSRSSSSRFLQATSSSRDDDCESSSDISEESCVVSGSHRSTLDRLYAWEKKLYEEVKSGERVRIAYEKKCMQLRNHDVNGEDPSVVDRTRAVLRGLRTQLQVSIHSVQAVSKRIETLRDDDLHPQLMELIHGLARMWRTIGDCHGIQKRTIDEAKLLLFSPSAALAKPSVHLNPYRSASNLEAELRNWRSSLENWIDAQRSYARALAGWASRCVQPEQGRKPDGDGGAPPVIGVCIRWSRLLDSVTEARALEGLEFLAAGVGSVCAQQKEGAGPAAVDEAAMTAEKVAEVSERVLCAGIAVAVGSLAEFAAGSAEGYEALVKRCGLVEGRVDT